MDIQFHDDVSDRKAAEALLIDKPFGAYITWRFSDKEFFLSYNSPSTKKATHLPLTRTADGKFFPSESTDKSTTYKTLSEFISSRAYLRSASGERPEGVAALPSHIKPPTVSEDELAQDDDDYLDDSKWARGIRQSLPDWAFYGLFGLGLTVAAGSAAMAYSLYRQYDASVMDAAQDMARVGQHAARTASSVLFDALLKLDASSDIPAACRDAVSTWRDTLASGVTPLQGLYSASGADQYLGPLLLAVFACLVLALSMQCTHTGRVRRRYTPTEEQFLSGEYARKEPMCTTLQAWWIGAYLSLMTAALVCAALLSSRAWEIGQGPTAVQYAAHTLSTAFPPDVRAQTGTDERTPELYQLAMQRGMFGAAGVLSGVPDSCLEAVQPLVNDLVFSPAVMLSAPLPQAVHGLLGHFLSTGERTTGLPMSARDPVAWPSWFQGWLHRSADGSLSVVVPTQKAVAFGSVNTLSVVLATAFAMLFLQEQLLASWLPAVRRYFKDRARKAAAAPTAAQAEQKKKD